MDFVFVLAQDRGFTLGERLFARFPPEVAVPVSIGILLLVGFILVKSIVYVVRRITSHTQTKVDDAFADGLPWILWTSYVLVALRVAGTVFLREIKGGSEQITETGRAANTILSVVAVLALSICLVRVAVRMVDAWVRADAARVPIGPTIKFTIKLIVTPLALLTAAEASGIQMNGVLTAVGVGSLAVGLALQDTLKNIVAGVQLVLDQPIRAGDFVEVDRSARGTVMEIGLRSTKLRSPDNNVIIIPNSTIAGAIVTNLDYADRSFIQTFRVSAAYGSDTRRVEALLDEVVAEAAKDLEGVVAEQSPATLTELGESGIVYTVNVRLRQWAGRGPLVSELYHRICERLRAEGIEIPYPTRTLHIRGESVTAGRASPSSP